MEKLFEEVLTLNRPRVKEDARLKRQKAYSIANELYEEKLLTDSQEAYSAAVRIIERYL